MKLKTHWRRLWRLLLVVMLVALSMPRIVRAQEPLPLDSSEDPKSTIEIDFGFTAHSITQEIRDSIEIAVMTDQSLLPFDIYRFTLTKFQTSGNWIHAVLIPTHIVESAWEAEFKPGYIVEILGHHHDTGEWIATVVGSQGFWALAARVPRDFIDFSSSLTLDAASSTTVNYLFPWTKGQIWYLTQGWHSGNSLDFQPTAPIGTSNRVVLAASTGRLICVCDDSYQSNLAIVNDVETTTYVHLDKGTIIQDIINKDVVQGQFLGLLYNGNQGGGGDYQYNTACGKGTAAHLHITFPQKAITIDNHNANDLARSTPYTSSNTRTDNNGCPAPDEGGVILYKNRDSDCGYEIEGKGYVRVPVGETYTLPDGFHPYSLVVPPGYELTTYMDNGQVYSVFTNGNSNLTLPVPPIRSVRAIHCPATPSDPIAAILYSEPNYSCGGKTAAEKGFQVIPQSSPGDNPYLLPTSFGASSIRIAPGLLATLYQRNGTDYFENRIATRDSDDDSFAKDYFSPSFWGERTEIDNNAGAILVTGNPGLCPAISQSVNAPFCHYNSPPYVPLLTMPPDGFVTPVGQHLAPTLCWYGNSDPEGDQLQFQVEISSDTTMVNKWINSTSSPVCYRPSVLDRKYDTYQWRVRARDTWGAMSDWTTAWSFTIAPPNRPPAIAFNTANGDGFSNGVINTRERNWTFQGIANDPEGRLNRIQWYCSGDDCGVMQSQSGLSNWTYMRHGLQGKNTVFFRAYDAEGFYSNSRSLTLYIDLAAPATSISLNGEGNAANWPDWFTGPVEVSLRATDNATGQARAGVREIHYRVDGNAWQTRSGDGTNFALNTDGVHTVEYYAVDMVGNAESARVTTVRIDQTPPSPPAGIVEMNGAVHDVWQRNYNTPVFSWNPSTDATSGVWGYQFYFGQDPNGINFHTITADQPRQWMPQPNGVRTGTYYLRGRTRDVAGNWSVWTNLFTFRYDETPPENPTDVTHTTGITNTVWQRLTNNADFRWPIPHDEGSGIQGYSVYWGPDEAGESAVFITANAFTDPTPLCDTVAVCTGYLRLQSVDNVDNRANEWSTGFVLRYDNVPPVVDFTFNEGITTTDQTHITLNIDASDEGSGVQAMRVSPNGQDWLPWEEYLESRAWVLPGVSRMSWPVYVQVRDGVGLESTVVSHTIYLDVNREQPHSTNFRLFDHILSAGAGAYTSTIYSGRATVGQIADSAIVTSTNFKVAWGYEAGSQALPLIVPGYDSYESMNGIFASGTGATPSSSLNFRMLGTFSEIGLPADTTTLTSPQFTHQPGFLATLPDLRVSQPPTQTYGPPPEPVPLACETPSISINDGAAFTGQFSVTLSLCAPHAVEMQIRNTLTPTIAAWEPYTTTKTWMLTDTGPQTSARFVYADFKTATGEVYKTYFDDIIYDSVVPSISLTLDLPLIDVTSPITPVYPISELQGLATPPSAMWLTPRLSDATPLSATGAITLYVGSMDDNSGVVELQLSDNISFTNALWEPHAPIKSYTPPNGEGITTLYARARDHAGNVSSVISATFIYDVHGPMGGVDFSDYVAGPETVTETLHLMAWDDWSEVTDMRVSANPVFTDTSWAPYTYTLVVPFSSTMQSAVTMYAQYRDARGNTSTVYSDVLPIDITPPVAYVDVPASNSLTRALTVFAYDDLSGIADIFISNDPLMEQDVVTLTYPFTITWTFNESRIVFVQAVDNAGNFSEPYPVYAREFENRVFLPVIFKQG